MGPLERTVELTRGMAAGSVLWVEPELFADLANAMALPRSHREPVRLKANGVCVRPYQWVVLAEPREARNDTADAFRFFFEAVARGQRRG